MLALGIVLVVLAVLFGLGITVSSGDSTTMSVFGVDFGISVPTLFFLGVAAGIAVTFGLWLTKKGLGRGYRRQKEVRQLRQKVAAVDTTPASGGDSEVGEVQGAHSSREAVEADGTRVTAADPADAPAGRHAAEPDLDDPDSRTVDLSAGDRLAGERHTVADGTDSK